MSTNETDSDSTGYGTGTYGDGAYGEPRTDGGSSDDPVDTTEWRTVVLWNETPGERTTYTLATDGDLRKNSDAATVNTNDEISADGTTASGTVLDKADAYDIAGAITRFEWSGIEPLVSVDGTEVPPDQLVGYDGEPEPEPEPEPTAEHTTVTVTHASGTAPVVLYGQAPDTVSVEVTGGLTAGAVLAIGDLPQCSGATGDGDRCSRDADVEAGSLTCWQHDDEDIPDGGWA